MQDWTNQYILSSEFRSSLECMSDVLIEYKLHIYLIPIKIGEAQVIEHIGHSIKYRLERLDQHIEKVYNM